MSGVELVPATLEDLDEEYCSWYIRNDEHLKYFTGSRRQFTTESVREDFKLGVDSGRCYYYLIKLVNGSKIGNIKIGPVDEANKTSDLVCLIGDRSFKGRGLAAEAIQQATKLAFEVLDIRRLHGGMYETHQASVKAYMRAGWRVEAKLRGYYYVDGESVDRVCVSCLNPKYFSDENEQIKD